MNPRTDGEAMARADWREVVAGFAGLLCRALVLAIAIGLLLTAAGIALP